MAKSAPEIHDLFRTSFDRRTRTELVRCALQAHAASKDIVRHAGFSPAQAQDALPYVRRADFETRLRGLVIPGVGVHDRKNPRGTSSFVELVTNDVCVTALTRTWPPTRLPAALYRDTRAEDSQLTIFDQLRAEQQEGNAPRLYGVYVYGGLRKDTELSLARIYFPIPGLRLLAVRPLDLLVEHAAVMDELRAEAQASRPMKATTEIVMGLKKKADEGRG